MTQESNQVCGESERAVENPFVRPDCNPRKRAPQSRSPIYHETVEEFLIHELKPKAQFLEWVDEERFVEFGKIEFVDEETVEARPFGSNHFPELGILQI